VRTITVLPFTVWVLVVTVAPDPLVVATAWDTAGPLAPLTAAWPPAAAVVELPAAVATEGKA
jgi:hypothetical protein